MDYELYYNFCSIFDNFVFAPSLPDFLLSNTSFRVALHICSHLLFRQSPLSRLYFLYPCFAIVAACYCKPAIRTWANSTNGPNMPTQRWLESESIDFNNLNILVVSTCVVMEQGWRDNFDGNGYRDIMDAIQSLHYASIFSAAP